MKLRTLTAAGLAATLGALVAACGGGSASGSGSTVNWWTWDDKQAAAYQTCASAFEKANPGTTVKITQYNVDDYFTKLTAGFVGGTAPDAFQNSVQYFQAYASQHQLLPLDDLIARDKFDLKRFSVGVDSWKFTDGKQYALPLDWSATGLYYNTDAITKAGYTPADLAKLTWNPDDGGTFEKVAAHLSVDKNGVRGDQPGFDKDHVATYGTGQLASRDFIGEATWSSFAMTTGWRLADKQSWPTTFSYGDPVFAKTLRWVRSLTDRGFAPKLGTFTTGGQATISDVDLIGSGKVAMETAGSWSAGTFAKLPGVKVGIAPTVLGTSGKRAALTNSNGNNIWAGTKNPDLTWKWVSYMGSPECQSAAGASGTFFPSIPASMDAAAAAMRGQGVDLSVFTTMMKDGSLVPAVVYGNGAALQDAERPLFEAYFAHQRDDDVFAEMASKSRDVLAKQ
ncbi:sugar ABC transporter substrate-binding protein [Amycolatopsis sp. OK19-0408]|uniref:Sugar ABC transporter substrate-binding protein n=1 Tax=Amycolatopsis iheyensis TaxID=2945988 RepID=A0A9X2SPJ8_9PSEU|nr:sugar ABC transporter substrate-binding protein [Amycolatopsis iheyensis]MCR6487630.1 sugar ABC transporter substrate-binding protein [Amycolatopsis iheyensis]